jgi:acetyltransferase-like isoleucine patch superfamily enzyme
LLEGGLSLGDYTQIGPNVMVWSHSTHLQALRGETGINRERITYTPTKIGKNCFIAGPSVILAGVTIGDRVLVPPMSVVDRDLPDKTMYRSANSRLEKLESRVAELERALAALGGGK